jgi:hypothetical protein
MLRIQRTAGPTTVLTVSGRLHCGNVHELCQLLEMEPAGQIVAIDLADLVLADHDVVRLLREFEDRHRIILYNCPAYVRTWMSADD